MIYQSNLKGLSFSRYSPLSFVVSKRAIEKMIVQGYDGARSMSGKEKSVRAIVKESYPLAVYVHCSTHVLILVLVKPCAIPELHSTFDFVGDIASFFFLNQAVKEMHD